MSDILHHLARSYRQSVHGSRPTTRDFIIDYEKFLRTSKADDGDNREIAERELCEAALKSRGLLRIERHSRSGIPECLRLCADGGEAWLFKQIGEASPIEQRVELSNVFREIAARPVPERWQQAWVEWFNQLSKSSLEGASIQPFRRNDSNGNAALADALVGILHWEGPSLIRYASTAICGDSKQLQKLEAKLRPALRSITGSDALEDFGILRKPRFVTFHGPLVIRHCTQETDFSTFAGPVALSETNFPSNTRVSTTATICLTVENEDTFHELAATNRGVLLILTSYAGSGVRRMINLLPANLCFLHFGDGDPAGSDILRDLRAKTRRDIHPILIPGQDSDNRRPLAESERNSLMRLLESDLPMPSKAHVKTLIESGTPIEFEQEGIPIQQVWDAILEYPKH